MKAAVIGHPIAHSKSPALHRAAYRWLELEVEYSAIDVPPEDLAQFIARLRSEPVWLGLSVTMPHKAALVPLVDELDVGARILGVLNTVQFRSDGSLLGSNTDVLGILGALRHAGLRSIDPESAPPAILGGGGTTLAALAALELLGASAVQIYLRDTTKVGALHAVAAELELELEIRSLGELPGQRPGLLLSTLPPRAADSLLGAIEPTGGLLLDVAYDPWPSALQSIGKPVVERWFPVWRCCFIRQWSRSSSSPGSLQWISLAC